MKQFMKQIKCPYTVKKFIFPSQNSAKTGGKPPVCYD